MDIITKNDILEMNVGSELSDEKYRIFLKPLKVRRERDGVRDAVDAVIHIKDETNVFRPMMSHDFFLSQDNVMSAKKWLCERLGL